MGGHDETDVRLFHSPSHFSKVSSRNTPLTPPVMQVPPSPRPGWWTSQHGRIMRDITASTSERPHDYLKQGDGYRAVARIHGDREQVLELERLDEAPHTQDEGLEVGRQALMALDDGGAGGQR